MDGYWIDPQLFILTRWIFLRAMGVIYLAAFLSYGVQLSGLIGSNGILPAGRYLEQIRKSLGWRGYWLYPTLAWISSSDAFLKGLCGLGVLLSILLLLGIQSSPVLLLLWALYLSLVVVGQIFLSYQWDALLLEAGFLCIFLVPPSLLPAQAAGPPPAMVIFLFRWLVFRLMFMSGAAKLASRDPTWKSLTAMAYHYETQPLPNPLAWLLHQAPPGFQKFSTLFALFVELVVPFFAFAPGLPRYVAAGLIVLLQLLILLTGNFAFFNILSIALAFFLLDDPLIAKIIPGLVIPSTTGGPGWGYGVLIPLAALQILVGAGYLLFSLSRYRQGLARRLRPLLQPLIELTGTLRIVNSYGLFAAMTTQRPEIILEGSQDGEEWLTYEFKYKAGRLQRPPPIVAPHQPHLDWQMWFAALGSYADNPWLLHFVERLLSGSPSVAALLAYNPFPDHPPRYIRAMLYDYHFTRLAEFRRGGDWWRRELIGVYLPPVSFQDEP